MEAHRSRPNRRRRPILICPMPSSRPDNRSSAPRAGEARTQRIELRLTLEELHQVRRLAQERQTTMSDLIRLTLLEAASEAGERSPVVLGRELVHRIVAGKKSDSVV